MFWLFVADRGLRHVEVVPAHQLHRPGNVHYQIEPEHPDEHRLERTGGTEPVFGLGSKEPSRQSDSGLLLIASAQPDFASVKLEYACVGRCRSFHSPYSPEDRFGSQNGCRPGACQSVILGLAGCAWDGFRPESIPVGRSWVLRTI